MQRFHSADTVPDMIPAKRTQLPKRGCRERLRAFCQERSPRLSLLDPSLLTAIVCVSRGRHLCVAAAVGLACPPLADLN